MDKEYQEGDEYYEVKFEMPKGKLQGVHFQAIANQLIEKFQACNVRIIPCKVKKSPPRLEVDKANNSYTIFNTKHVRML